MRRLSKAQRTFSAKRKRTL